jgi:hypothetical protein
MAWPPETLDDRWPMRFKVEIAGSKPAGSPVPTEVL